MKKHVLIIGIILLSASNLLAQSDWSGIRYHNRRALGVSIKYLNLSNPTDPVNQVGINRIYPEFDMMTMRFSKGAWSSSYKNKLIGDYFGMALDIMINNDKEFLEFKEYATEIANFIGWWNFAKNIIFTNNLAVAVGGHFGDYYLSYSSDLTTHNTGFRNDPQGFYVAAGPAIMIDYRLPGANILHLESAAAYAQYLADGNGFGSYPAPIIINSSLEFRTDYWLFAGLEYVTFMNRGDSNFRGQRLEIKVGARFSRN